MNKKRLTDGWMWLWALLSRPDQDEEQVSNCCNAQFGFPGWPDNDICSACGEHADIEEGENNG